MSRRLSREERELWDRLRRSVQPLHPSEAEPDGEEVAPSPAGRGDEDVRRPAAPALQPQAVPAPPLLVTFGERDRRRLSRGLTEIDARIDLHGMRQDRAFAALVAFLRHAQVRGARIVLVITGKGREGDEGRGVLRHAVPHWISRPEFRDLVVGFEEAGRRHGGAGALYVRLRRRREARRSAAQS